MQLCGSLSICWHWPSLGLEWKLTFSSPVSTAEFSKFAGILSAALSFFFPFYFIFKFYNIVLILPNIEMNPPQVYMCSPSWALLPPPSSLPIPSLWVIPVHQPQASCILHRTWTGDSFLIWYYTCFNAILPNHSPTPSPTDSKRLFYTSVSLLLSCIQGYHYHLSKFHIYVLVYCIGVFLSGLLHSV